MNKLIVMLPISHWINLSKISAVMDTQRRKSLKFYRGYVNANRRQRLGYKIGC